MVAFMDQRKGTHGVEPIGRVLSSAPSTCFLCRAEEWYPTKRSARAAYAPSFVGLPDETVVVSPLMAAEEVRVTFRATAALDEATIAALFDVLSDEERARCKRFVFPRDRRDFVVAHALLRHTLSRYHPIPPRDWVFVSEAGGKPRLSGDCTGPARLQFNLAHTDGLVACAVSRTAEVGVDVEAFDCRTEPLEIARRYFSAAEAEHLRRCAPADRPGRFVEIWTLKEAYIKAIGKGLSLPLDDFAFGFDGLSTLWFTRTVSDAAWSFALFAPTERHRLAVAARTARVDGGPAVVVCALAPAHADADADAITIQPIRSCTVSVAGSAIANTPE